MAWGFNAKLYATLSYIFTHLWLVKIIMATIFYSVLCIYDVYILALIFWCALNGNQVAAPSKCSNPKPFPKNQVAYIHTAVCLVSLTSPSDLPCSLHYWCIGKGLLCILQLCEHSLGSRPRSFRKRQQKLA